MRRLRPLALAYGAAQIASTALIVAGLALIVGPAVAPIATAVVLSGSMEPAVPVGALAISRRVPAEELRVGDVITYRPEQRETGLAAPGASRAVDMVAPGTGEPTVTHRIVEIVERGRSPVLRTKGDANNVPDPQLVRLDRVAWKYAFGIPYLGYVVAFSQTPAGRLLLVALPAAALGALWLRDRVTQIRARRSSQTPTP